MSTIVWVRDKEEVFVKAKVVKDYTTTRNGRSTSRFLEANPSLFGVVSRINAPQQDLHVLKEDVWRYNYTHDNPAPDLATINDLNEPAVLNVIRERLKVGSIYTKIEPLVISVNPYKRIPLLYDIEHYHTLPYDQREAHVYCIARNALQRVSSINQSIAVSGESGAGKTEACKLLISYLTSTAKGAHHTHSGGGLDLRILACNPILEAFGNASTLRNDNSSRFGKYLRLQVQHGVLCGAELTHYLLEKGRVINQHPEERSFHVFYQLLAGANNAMRSSLLLDSGAFYNYLGASTPKLKEKANDSEDFFDLIKALSDIGMGLKTQNDIFRLIATILHLGNFEFEYNHDDDATNVSCRLKTSPYVEFVSAVMGVSVESLGPALTNRTVQTSGRSSFYSVPLNLDQAKGNAAALAKELYNKLFAWIIYSCNSRMSAPANIDPSSLSYIGILDIFGFEVFDENRFEQLCINYCNEAIQSMFNRRIFEAEISRLLEEGVPVDGIAYESCTESLSLLEGESGIFKLADEFCFLHKKADDDLPLLDLIDKTHSNLNSRYIGRNSKAAAKFPAMRTDTFIVKHFAGDAMYSIIGFIAANGDKLENDLSDVVRGCDSALIKQFYEVQGAINDVKKIAEERSSSKKRRHSVKKITISAKFRANLKTLITELESTNTQFLRCIKPNQRKAADVFDAPLVYSQLCYSGVIGVVAIRKCSYPLRQTWVDIHDRLMSLKLYKGVSEISLAGEYYWSHEQRVEAARNLFQIVFPSDSGDYYSGKTTVYMKQNIYEKIADFFSTKSVISIQQRWRGVFTRQRISKIRVAIIKLQRLWWQKKYRAKRLESVILCQSFFRMCQAKAAASMMKRIKEVSYLLYRWRTRARIRKRQCATLIRLFLLRPSWRLPISRLPPAHKTLTRWFQAKLTRMDYLNLRSSVTRISAWYRGRSMYRKYLVEIVQLRIIKKNRRERQGVQKIVKFLRALCFRNYSLALFANVKAGLLQPTKTLLRRIRRSNVKPTADGGRSVTGTSIVLEAESRTVVAPAASVALSTRLQRSLTRSLTRTGSVFDIGSAMPFNYLAFVPTVDEDGEFVPGTAILSGTVRFGRSVILKDININDIRDSSEGFATLLHTAANHGYDDIVSLLIEAGADPFVTDSVKFTPLHRVMRLGKVGYPVMSALLASASDLAGMTDLYGRTARDIAEEKSTEFDQAELGMIEALKTSERCFLARVQSAERKKKHLESVSQNISIEDFLAQLHNGRDKIEQLEEDVANRVEYSNNYKLAADDSQLHEPSCSRHLYREDDYELTSVSGGRSRSAGAPAMRRNARRGSVSGRIQDQNPFKSSELTEDQVYKKTKILRRGSLNSLESAEISMEKKANLARFIQSTMKRKSKKAKPLERSAQVSATDLILKRAYLDAWEKSHLLRQTNSISLAEYLADNEDICMSVIVPGFDSLRRNPSEDKLLMRRSYTGDFNKTRVPFVVSPPPSPGSRFMARSPAVQFNSPLTHSNKMHRLSRPLVMEKLSILIPVSPTDEVESDIYKNESRDEIVVNSLCSGSHKPIFDATAPDLVSVIPVDTRKESAVKTRVRRNSIVSNIASFDIPSKLKRGHVSPTCISVDAVHSKAILPARSVVDPVVGNRAARIENNVCNASTCQNIASVVRSPASSSDPNFIISAPGFHNDDNNKVANIVADLGVHNKPGSFWDTWNSYVSNSCPAQRKDTHMQRFPRRLKIDETTGRDVTTRISFVPKDQNKAKMQSDEEYQRLIAKRKIAEKDPIMKIFLLDSAKKDAERKCLSGTASFAGKTVNINSPIKTNDHFKAKAVSSKTFLPPRAHAYPPGVRGKR